MPAAKQNATLAPSNPNKMVDGDGNEVGQPFIHTCTCLNRLLCHDVACIFSMIYNPLYVLSLDLNKHRLCSCGMTSSVPLLFAYRCCCLRKRTMTGWSLSACLNTTKVGPSALLVLPLSKQTTTDSLKLLLCRLGIYRVYYEVEKETGVGCRLKDKPRSSLLFACDVPESSIWCLS